MRPFENLDVEEDKIRGIKEKLISYCKQNNLHPLDLTQGNPVGSISKDYAQNMKALLDAEVSGNSLSNAYCSSVGHPDFLRAVADLEKRVNGLPFTDKHILAVPGAAVGVSTLLYGLSEEKPEGEVLLLAPYFPPYAKYIEHNGLKPRIVDFDVDEEAILNYIKENISQDTRAMIINSPNNPSGHIYSKDFLEGLGKILRQNDHVLLISDEPYRNIILPGEEMVPVLKNINYENSAVVYSFSKEGRIAGSRIGYIALHPDFPDYRKVISALANSLPNRGIVQAPTREQFALAKSNLPLDVDWSEMLNHMKGYFTIFSDLGFEVLPAKGGLFLSVKHPDYDGSEFHKRLLEKGVGTVPGVAFGIRDYVRLAICAKDALGMNSLLIEDRFKNIIKKS